MCGVRAADADAVEPFLCAKGRARAESAVHGNHRQAVLADAVVWVAPDGPLYDAPRPLVMIVWMAVSVTTTSKAAMVWTCFMAGRAMMWSKGMALIARAQGTAFTAAAAPMCFIRPKGLGLSRALFWMVAITMTRFGAALRTIHCWAALVGAMFCLARMAMMCCVAARISTRFTVARAMTRCAPHPKGARGQDSTGGVINKAAQAESPHAILVKSIDKE
jgi:hypothetical protein